MNGRYNVSVSFSDIDQRQLALILIEAATKFEYFEYSYRRSFIPPNKHEITLKGIPYGVIESVNDWAESLKLENTYVRHINEG